jgi:hypothetical protein
MGRSQGVAGRLVLLCEECGERLVLGGPEEEWLSTRTVFECGCGKGVSLASRVEESVRDDHGESPRKKPAPTKRG